MFTSGLIWLAAVWMVDGKFDLNCLSCLNVRAMLHKIESVIVRECSVLNLVGRKEPKQKKNNNLLFSFMLDIINQTVY